MTHSDELRRMKELAERVLSAGCYKPTADTHYRIIKYPPIDLDLDAPAPITKRSGPEEPPVVLIDLKQPSWSSKNSALKYCTTAKVLYEAAKAKEIPFHVSMTEILRSIDCRLAEILFYCGIYPENHWNNPRRQLSWSKKLEIVKVVLPKSIIPITLLRDLSQTRNITEHQFYEPTRQEVVKCREMMDAVIEMTNGLLDILFSESVFKYQIDDTDALVAMQIMRENGSLLVMNDDEVPTLRQGIPANEELGLRLINKLLHEIKFHLDNDPNFKKKLGF